MGKFYITDGQNLIGIGECQDGMEEAQAFGGYTAHPGLPPDGMVPRPAPPLRYDALREREYPLIGDQLDVLWKLLGPTAQPGSDAAAVYRRILDVKQKYPKPPGK